MVGNYSATIKSDETRKFTIFFVTKNRGVENSEKYSFTEEKRLVKRY